MPTRVAAGKGKVVGFRNSGERWDISQGITEEDVLSECLRSLGQKNRGDKDPIYHVFHKLPGVAAWPTDAQLGHAVLQRRWLQTKNLSSAVLTAYSPACSFQNI